MSTVIRRIKSLPPQAQLTQVRMDLVGFPEGSWSYDRNHLLADMTKVVQIRNIKGVARKSKVDHYKTILKPFTSLRDELTMPPVVFTNDGFLLDGNTRTAAAGALGWMTYPAFVLDFNYVNAPTGLLDQFFELAAVLNLTHGDNLDRASTEDVIARLAKEDSSAADLARRLGVSRGMVQNVLYARTGRLRADRLNISYDVDHISRTHMADLGRENDTLTDTVFTRLLELSVTGKLSSTEQQAVMRQVRAATTEPAKLELIAAELAGRDGITKGRATKPRPSAQLRQALGKVINRDPGELVETNPASFTAHRQSIRAALDQLTKVLDRQYQMEEDLETSKG
jgi:lambda repressor-like predicted transcriptional regulator